jgi:predicted ATPase/DNA-binding SARP family transcriptional activator
LRFFLGDEAVRLEGPPGTLRLCAYLLLSKGRMADRSAAASSLWTDCSDETSRANLRRHLGYLERALERFEIGILRTGSTVGLEPRCALSVDVDEFVAACNSGRFEDAALLYSADLLESFTDDWVVKEREWLRRRHVDNLRRAVDDLEVRGELAAALRWAIELRRIDPWREDSLRTVMRIRRESGQRIEALQAYRDFSTAIHEAFGAQPSEETRSLYREIAGSPEDAAPPGALPAEITSCFGRDRDVEAICTTFEQSRLITLVGAPGVGKTRVALRAGRALQERFADGVWFVELASLDDEELIGVRIAETLRGNSQSRASLEELLRSKQVLLILDNAEHLLAACAALAVSLLDSWPRLSVLVTSRAPLSVDGEVVRKVEPLDVPRLNATVEEAARSHAVRLFLDRAAAASGNPGEHLPLSEVAEICRRLDGVPLAIEFAAARIRGMTLRHIKAGLDSRFQLLTQERRTATKRQRTLYASFDWSYRLLSAEERAMFCALSVFRGGWTVDAAAAISSATGQDRPYALGILTTLVENSLVVAPTADSAEARYDFLESIRAFSAEQLSRSPSEQAAALVLHASYFANRFIARDEELRRAHAHQYFAEIDRERDNIRSALTYLIAEDKDPVLGLRLALAISRYWFDRGFASEGAHWIGLALESGKVQGNIRAQALLCLATITRNAGDYELAYRQFSASLELLRDGGDGHDVIKARLQLSNVARILSRSHEAMGHAAAALELCEDLGDAYFAAFARASLGCIHLSDAQIEPARAQFMLALEAFDANAAGGDAALVVNNLGLCALYEGDFEVAIALCRQALERSRIARYDFSISHALHSLAVAHLRKGDLREARSYLERALTSTHQLIDRELSLMCIEATAELAFAVGDAERAAVLLAAAERGRAQFHALMAPIEARFIDDLKGRLAERLGSAAYSAKHAVGLILSLAAASDQARAYIAESITNSPLIRSGSEASTVTST